MTIIEKAAQEYLNRKDRRSHPSGKFDNAGRWYPSSDEERDCCRSVRSPSRAYPYSYMVHCRTIIHIADLYGVHPSELRRAVSIQSPPDMEGGENYYKIVAIHPETGKLVSIYDGETEYEIGITLNGKAKQEHKGGYYCYASVEAARKAPFPTSSVGINWEKKLIQVKAEGRYVVYGETRKLAFSRITLIKVLD